MSKNNPEYIYNQIAGSVFSPPPTILCQLHNPCATFILCPTGQKQPVVDFDKIETNFHRSLGKPSSPSVDALTYTNDKLCFVEIKGWKLFLENQKRVTHLKIQKQVDRYHLQEKLINSIIICEEITEQKGLLDTLSIYFILVTDIDIRQNPLNAFAQNLNYLAETSSDWESVCNKVLGEKLNCIPYIKTRYIHCKDFDSLLLNLN